MKWAIVIGIIALVIFIMTRKKPVTVSTKEPEAKIPLNPLSPLAPIDLPKQIEDSLKYIITKYGADTARIVEKLYRLETAHFTSGQFKKTFSPGMEKHSDTFPFGWTAMRDYWANNSIVPGFYTMAENGTGIPKTFLKFPDVKTAMESLVFYINKYGPLRWYSLNPESQARYKKSLDSIIPRITNKLLT